MVEALRRMFRHHSPYDAVMEEVRGFKALRPGWNSHRAPEIRDSAIKTALEVLQAAGRLGAPAPSAAPTSLGDVALTWMIGDVEAQLLVGDHTFYYSVARATSPKVLDQGSPNGIQELETRFIERHLIGR